MVMDRVGAVGTAELEVHLVPHERLAHRRLQHGAAGRLQRHLRHHPGHPDHLHGRQRQRGRNLRQHPVTRESGQQPETRSSILAAPGTRSAAAFVLALGACGKRAARRRLRRSRPSRRRWAAAKLPSLPRVRRSIPARRTNVLPVPPRQGPPDDPVLVALGKKIFFDERLSEPPGTSCASCHDPARAFSGNHGSRIGVPLGSRPGHFARRSTPSVLYMRYVPAFHYFEDDEAPAPEPRGGFFWDGRADSLAELVRQPLFNPDEMNAGTPRRSPQDRSAHPTPRSSGPRSDRSTDPEAVLRGVGRGARGLPEERRDDAGHARSTTPTCAGRRP